MATLTSKQRDALQDIAESHFIKKRGSGMGGAVRRMLGRMLDAGLIEDRSDHPGYRITDAGRAALTSSPSPRTNPTLPAIGSDAFREGAERLLADIKGPRHARR